MNQTFKMIIVTFSIINHHMTCLQSVTYDLMYLLHYTQVSKFYEAYSPC